MYNVVIIPVFNQLELLQDCVRSVIENTDNLKLIIIDDGSTDLKTREWIKEFTKKNKFDRIWHKKAMGFSNACNDAIDLAMSKYDFTCLCLLNSDTVIRTKNWFDIVRWHFEVGNKIGLASVMSDNALAQTVKNTDKYLATIDQRITVHSYLIHGFCYFIAKSLILEIGKLDEITFPHYGSEDDYSLKSIAYGYTNLLVGSVLVSHKNSKSYTEAQRSQIIKKSAPDLRERFGKRYVDRCGIYSYKAARYVLTHRKNK
jgi:GT2 family glycosyltransferase